jgi:hypothetical protein
MARRFSLLPWLAILLLLIGQVGIWFWVTPHRAYDRLMRALAFGSESELAETADLPVVRQHFMEDVRSAITRRSDFHLRGAAADSVVTMAANVVLTPQGLADLVSSFGTPTPGPAAADTLLVGTEVSFHYQGLSRVDVRIRPTGASEQSAGILTFTRTGVTWRLTRVWSEQLLRTQGAP